MSTMQFIADVNKTVSIQGNVFTITLPAIPPGVHIYANEVEVTSGETIALTENMQLTFSVDPVSSGSIAITASNYNTIKYNGTDLNLPITITPDGDNTLDFIGATAIPQVTINGSGINGFTVNSGSYSADDLPFSFTPQGGISNSIFVDGQETEQRRIQIFGTDIETMTINNVDTPLPYNAIVSEDLNIAVAGKIYQLDISSIGGAKLITDGVIISDGNSVLHSILDIDHDTFLDIDGTHTLTVNGTNIKSISFNGVVMPVENLPFTVKNVAMLAHMVVNGFEPSEVHVSGHYINTATLDGKSIAVDEHGDIDIEFETVEDNHFITIIGSQPREYGISWNDHDATTISMDGKNMISGITSLIQKDVYVEAVPEDIPIHFEKPSNVTVQINGKREDSGNDFTVKVNQLTEVDITTETCEVTIDYGDDSYTVTVPQAIVYLTAPHRDGWIFDGWSSSNTGINNPKSVKTTIDLRSKLVANIVAHYQRCVTINKPNAWN